MTNPTTATVDCQPYTYQFEGETPLDVLDPFAPFDEDEPTPDYWERLYDERREFPEPVGTFGHPACPEW